MKDAGGKMEAGYLLGEAMSWSLVQQKISASEEVGCHDQLSAVH